jgi:hypothetical protein
VKKKKLLTQKVVTNDEEVTGSKKFVFSTFGMYVTNLRGNFVENVKKVQNQYEAAKIHMVAREIP